MARVDTVRVEWFITGQRLWFFIFIVSFFPTFHLGFADTMHNVLIPTSARVTRLNFFEEHLRVRRAVRVHEGKSLKWKFLWQSDMTRSSIA